jgi:hypothetical protein
MKPLQRMVLYVFPLYLTTAEWIIRSIFGAQAFSVEAITNSISVGGLVLLLPFLIPSPYTDMPSDLRKLLEAKKATVYRTGDQVLATSAWIFLVVLTLVWIYSLSHHANSITVSLPWMGTAITPPAIISAVIYLVGILHTEAKERIS